MAQYIVGTSAQSITAPGSSRPIIQNLGPGNLYIDADETDTTTSGIKLTVGAIYESATPGNDDVYWLLADTASTDVRVILVGGNPVLTST